MGFLVTAVSDIVGISPEEIQPMPKVGGLDENGFVQGIIASGDRTLRVLDISELAAAMAAEPVEA
ncbi:putative chemotaxis scaffold protein, CheW1 [Roseobacter sp. GAI101]|nr:putative chemotaxis scaffold protein, CheW1 [Roseobacter sp. GAI101]